MNIFTFDDASAGSVQANDKARSDGAQETSYLLSSAKNARRLARSIAQLSAGGVMPRELSNDGPTEHPKRAGGKG
jgi:hypothetical protein